MSDILPLLTQLQPVLSKTTCRQLHLIIVAIFAMTGNITQRGISRWTGKGGSYRSVQRFFHTPIDWLALQWKFFERFCWDKQAVYLLAGDETVISKSGKHTYGLDRLFASLFGKPIPGVACFSLALIHVGNRQAYSLCNEQVVRTEEEKQQAKQRTQQAKSKKKSTQPTGRGPGRPTGSKNKNKAEVVLNAELQRILLQTKKALALLKDKLKLTYFVLDGHFGNRYATAMVQELGLHIISKMRYNAALFLLPSEEVKQKHPRQKYGAQLDYAGLPSAKLVSSETEGGYRTDFYQMVCWHKDFGMPLNVVVVVKTHIASGRHGHVVLFSTDLVLSASLLVDYYALRFQIEFTFRDAKQHFGLEDFQCVGATSVGNSMGLAFFLVNLSTYLLGSFGVVCPGAGILDLKSHYRGGFYLDAVLKLVTNVPEGISYGFLMEQISQIGRIHSGSASCLERELAA